MLAEEWEAYTKQEKQAFMRGYSMCLDDVFSNMNISKQTRQMVKDNFKSNLNDYLQHFGNAEDRG